MKKLLAVLPLAAALLLSGCARQLPEVMDLSGEWQLALSTDPLDLSQLTLHQGFDDSLTLPGILSSQSKGTRRTDTTTMHLNSVYEFTGTAWYRRTVDVPSSWEGLKAELLLERTKISAVWVDGVSYGYSTIISASQKYELPALTPGSHELVIAVNNDPSLHTVGGSHAYTEHTMTNWNGILGRMELRPQGAVRMTSLQVTPRISDKKAMVKICIENDGDTLKQARIVINAKAWNTPEQHAMPERTVRMDLAPGKNIIKVTCAMGDDALLWSDHAPALYHLTAEVKPGRMAALRMETDFGLREFTAGEFQFAINGTPVFLRGKHDGGTFPMLGYAPVDTASWLRYYRICKEYGINHVRFHSYTPPEAAFLAADMAGIYVQAELPNWAAFTSDDPRHTEWMEREGKAAADDFGNHASFVMFTLGNELSGEREIAEKMVRDLRTYDGRRLYAFGSNNFLDDPFFGRNDDFWVSFRTGRGNDDRSTDVRGSASCNEDLGSGVINSTYPSTRRSYDQAVNGYHLPIVGHEVGQYQAYPYYAEMAKYPEHLQAWNFARFRELLKKAGMLDQADDFARSSGASMYLLYREEMEMARRTEHFAGYQLLDLQDYPGQGTALVGILDAFMDSKGIVTPETFRSTGDDVVPLLCMDKYCWTWDETFAGDVKVSYYAPEAMVDALVTWKLVSADGKTAAQGELKAEMLKPGSLDAMGTVELPLASLRSALAANGQEAVTAQLLLTLEGTPYNNVYPLWIYPGVQELTMPAGVKVVRKLDAGTLQQLQQGGTVVFFPEAQAIEKKSVGPQFINEFWNWLMFKGICEDNNRDISQGTMGLLVNPAHPLFAKFPTKEHTEWQWWSIMMHARPFVLDDTDASYRPVVQVIDNIDRNHKLGIVFEFKVGDGRLVVCTADLPRLEQYPEARQFYRALLAYAASDKCAPQYSVTPDRLREMF